MTIEQIKKRLKEVREIIKNDETTNYHTIEYMRKIWKEEIKLRTKLFTFKQTLGDPYGN